jgi:hypothetical protein
MYSIDEPCPTCGSPAGKKLSLPLHLLVAALIGLSIGTGFVAYWFGTTAGFFHFMALIHEGAGTLLGLIVGSIVYYIRRTR